MKTTNVLDSLKMIVNKELCQIKEYISFKDVQNAKK